MNTYTGERSPNTLSLIQRKLRSNLKVYKSYTNYHTTREEYYKVNGTLEVYSEIKMPYRSIILPYPIILVIACNWHVAWLIDGISDTHLRNTHLCY